MPMTVRTFPDPWMALGIAVHFVAKREPFAQFPAGDLTRTLAAQTRRGHYLFALDTNVRPAKVRGYCGWALFTTDVADRCAQASGPLPDGLEAGGDVVWLLTAAVENSSAYSALQRELRSLYPGHRLMAVRHKSGRRIVLERRSKQPAATRDGDR